MWIIKRSGGATTITSSRRDMLAIVASYERAGITFTIREINQ